MTTAALLTALLLSQAEGEAPAPAPPPALVAPAPPPALVAPAHEDHGDDGAGPAPKEPTPLSGIPAAASKTLGVDEVKKLMLKMPDMKEDERVAALQQIQKKLGNAVTNPVLPPGVFDIYEYTRLSEADQVQVTARYFFESIIEANAGALVASAGTPFLLEDKRFDRPEELRTEISRHLRGKRTDLLKLYGIEVLTPQDMEKKFGKPPARLSGWNFRGPKTYVAVGNLSGRASVLLFRQVGLAWQVVGWHD